MILPGLTIYTKVSVQKLCLPVENSCPSAVEVNETSARHHWYCKEHLLQLMETRTVKIPTSSLDRFVGLSTKNLFNRFSQSWRKRKKEKKINSKQFILRKADWNSFFNIINGQKTPNALQHKSTKKLQCVLFQQTDLHKGQHCAQTCSRSCRPNKGWFSLVMEF